MAIDSLASKILSNENVKILAGKNAASVETFLSISVTALVGITLAQVFFKIGFSGISKSVKRDREEIVARRKEIAAMNKSSQMQIDWLRSDIERIEARQNGDT